ncbi:long-chain fatty acid transport protein [Ereboglobus sp. PH5-10]|uniref:OmpP1/FadL family transporter n=1 Tax=Ereboglobus sp. PH5-10 TaxID=2940629 RepID=UPI00240641B6|nr:OmpP1/FadL family transporter [Ereboglobus sp. PH5-10]MDF9826229.1 long-chain fatty acid transport protein [Ereboglobus sp. PH5-10]
MHPNAKAAKRSLLSTLALSVALVATLGTAHGAGFAIYETDARGFAMANANVGRNDDASALYSNPAAITQLPGLQIKAGISLIMPDVDVTTWGSIDGQVPGEKKTSMNSYTAVIPNLYGTYRINDNMAIGMGIFVPYGLKSDFEKEPIVWPGAYNNYYTEIETVEMAPTFAYRLVHDQPWAKNLSVAVGLAILRTDITIKRQMALGGGYYSPLILEGDDWEFGYNLAVQYEVNDQLSFGIVYRSGFDTKITGASARILPNQAAGFDGRHSGKAWGKIDLPDSWSFGVNYSPVAPLNIGFQALRTNWGSYDKLTIQAFPDGAVSVAEKHWKDVWRYSLGAEYQLNNALALRAGFVIDKDPVNTKYADYMVPSNDRQIFSTGLGWRISKAVTLDFAYGYIKIKESTFDARPSEGVLGTKVHTGNAHIFSVSAAFRF